MKRVKKMLCLLLALVLVVGTILPNMKAKAENAGAFDKSTIDRIEVDFEGGFIEGDLSTFPEADELNNWKNMEGYDLHKLNPIVSVYYKSVEEPETYDGWDAINMEMREKFGATPVFRTHQDTTPYTLGPDNLVDVSFLGEFTCIASVSVNENPIKAIKVIADKPLYEGRQMVTKYEWVDNAQIEYKGYTVNHLITSIVVTEKDGTECVFNELHELESAYGIRPEVYTDETYANQWKPGKHMATMNFMGRTCNFEVELKENPIKNIEVKYHGVVIEDVTTKLDTHQMEFLFTFANGSQETFYIYNKVLGETIAPMFERFVPENQTITEGKAYWRGYVWEQEVILETDVMKLSDSPIKSVSVEATNDLVSSWHITYDGETQEEVLDPLCAKPQITVTYQDGSRATMGYYELEKKFPEAQPEIRLGNNSLEGLGKRTATLNFYGHTCPFDVNVIENPVDRISVVTTKPLIEGYRGDHYDLTFDGGVIITVYYKDGRTFSGTVDEMNDLFYAYPSEEYREVVIGKNVKKYTFLDKTCDVEYEVVKDTNPVVSIDAKVQDDAVIYKNQDSPYKAWYRYDHMIDVTLTYKDGTKLTGTIDEVNEQLDKKMKVVDQICVEDDQARNEWGLGTHEGFVTYRNLSVPIEMKVVENPYVKATISNEDGFTVVLEKKNGQTESYKAMRYVSGGSSGDSGNILGYIETDKGILPIETKFAGGLRKDYTNIFYMFVNGIKSNPLENCKWIEQQTIAKSYGDVPSVTLNNSAEELRQKVLTERDYENIETERVKAWLEISSKEGAVSTEEQSLLDQATDEMSGYQNGVVVDLTVYKQFSDLTQYVQKEKVPNLNGKISITMQVTEDVLASTTDPSTIKMVRIHNGETQVLPCVYDEATKTITFETDKFSTYAMVYQAPVTSDGSTSGGPTSGGVVSGGTTSDVKDNKVQENVEKQEEQPSPQTGDNSRIFVYFLLCAVSLMALVAGKKKEY